MADVSIWLAVGAGLLSFISPCCLPLYPSYISYITGVSISQSAEMRINPGTARLTMFHTPFFILGFSIIFFALGFSASWVGRLFSEYRGSGPDAEWGTDRGDGPVHAGNFQTRYS